MNTSKITATITTSANLMSNVATATKSVLPAALILGLLGALLALTPQASGQSANEVVQMRPFVISESVPIPTYIVRPTVALKYEGLRIDMTFWVDKSGKAYNVGSPEERTNPNLFAQLSEAIDHWKFTPAMDADGNPVARKVILPVYIRPSKNGTEALVAFASKK